MITNEQLNELEKLAKSATQKPWFVVSYETSDDSAISTMTKEEYALNLVKRRDYNFASQATEESYNSIYSAEILGSSEWLRALPADLDFIAAANPLVVLALIEKIKELELKIIK